MVKISIHQEDMAIINVYASNNRDLKYMKQKLTEFKGKNIHFNNTGWGPQRSSL